MAAVIFWLAFSAAQWVVVESKPVAHTTSALPPTKTNLRDTPQCTYTNVNPVNMPTASPFVSQAGWQYYPVGSQNGMILLGTYDNLWASGGGSLPGSNNYAEAVPDCAAVCESNPGCLSFNVLTVYESDFNDCIPTYECRFSNKVYDKADYYTDNGLPSYVWTLNSTANVPKCDFTDNSWASSQTWQNLGMNGYLDSVAKVNGLWSASSNFLVDLMSHLGWPGYGCTASDSSGSCNFPPITTCGDYLNYQVAAYEGFMANNYATFSKILTQVDNLGPNIFDTFWWTQPPSKTSFDPTSLIEGIVNGALGCIPDIGSGLELITSTMESLMPLLADNPPVPVTPDDRQSWNNFMAVIDTQITVAQTAITNTSRAVTQSNAIFSQVTQNGSWAVLDPNSLRPDADLAWANLKPFYMAKIAMQAMQAQSVFLLSVPVSQIHSNTQCTQAIADQFANYISDHTQGVAFCSDSAHVVIPILGWNLRTYSNFNLVQTVLNTTYSAVLGPSQSCYPGFGTNTDTITPYNSPAALPINAHTATVSFDMTQPCIYSLPYADFSIWKGQMSAHGYPDGYRPTNTDDIINTAQWFAYQLGMTSEMWLCGQCLTMNGWERCCEDWKPAKIITVNKPPVSTDADRQQAKAMAEAKVAQQLANLAQH